MSPFNKALVLAGLAKQADKGTLAANPTYGFGVAGGKIIDSPIKQDPSDVTSGSLAASSVDRTEVGGVMGFDTRGYMKMLGLILLGLYGAEVVTGVSPSLAHAYGLAAAQPYLSAFKSDNGVLSALRDVKVTGLNMKWTANGPVTITPLGTGTVLSFPETFAPTTDETGSESFLTPVGGVFQVAMVGAVPATARITAGEIDIAFGTTPVFASGSIEADDPGAHEVMAATCKLTVIPDDLAYWMQVVTGTADGIAVSPKAQYGSLSIGFKDNGSATGGLVWTGGKVAFLADRPDVDPKGGNVELALAGNAVMPSIGVAPLIPVLTNDVASYGA